MEIEARPHVHDSSDMYMLGMFAEMPLGQDAVTDLSRMGRLVHVHMSVQIILHITSTG
jgi:hypothetical protein